MLRSSPLSDAVTSSNLVIFPYTKIKQMQKEHDTFRSKPTVGLVRVGMCRALLSLERVITSSSLYGVPY